MFFDNWPRAIFCLLIAAFCIWVHLGLIEERQDVKSKSYHKKLREDLVYKKFSPVEYSIGETLLLCFRFGVCAFIGIVASNIKYGNEWEGIEGASKAIMYLSMAGLVGEIGFGSEYILGPYTKMITSYLIAMIGAVYKRTESEDVQA